MVHSALKEGTYIVSMNTFTKSSVCTCRVLDVFTVYQSCAGNIILINIFLAHRPCRTTFKAFDQLARPYALVIESGYKFASPFDIDESGQAYVLIGKYIIDAAHPIRIEVAQIN